LLFIKKRCIIIKKYMRQAMLNERIYLNESDDRIYIDTYVQDEQPNYCAAHVRDAILIIPGGAYAYVCGALEGESIALAFATLGYNAFVLHYGVGEERDVFPKQLLDAGRAMLYIRNNAEKYRINPERVFAVGFSAGGHLCGTISTMFSYPEVKAEFGDDAARIRPTAAILSYPVTTLNDKTHIWSFECLLRKKEEAFTKEDRARYSLDSAVTADTAPMFLWHTVEDPIVPVEGTIRLAHALAENKVPFKMSIYPYGLHGMGLANQTYADGSPVHKDPAVASWVKDAVEFFKTLPNY
jgi:acetyl esterase/lipase